ncbi:hypothetical protein FDECE_5702 [Fusarium decemcellulare]|nr:hypothetical protein FDECE_5702 [Fusarium decemcellulare]
MDAVVHDSHQSPTQIQQPPSYLHSLRTSPLPVPGTHAHPRARGRVEGEAHDPVRDALSSSLRSSKSLPIFDDDEPESDNSGPHHARPARSSSITEPDAHTSQRPPPPRHVVPPPPPPGYPRAWDILSQSCPQAVNSLPFPQLPPPPPPRNFSVPPPPPPPRHGHDVLRPRQATAQSLALSIDSDSETASDSETQSPVSNSAPPKILIELPPGLNARTSVENNSPSRRLRGARDSSPSGHDSDSGSDSLSHTIPRLIEDSTSISASTSDVDSITLRNSRQFPPLLPTAPNVTSGGRSRKASMTNRITSWISQYEGNRAPRGWPGPETRGDLSTIDAGRSHVSRGSVPSEDTVELLWTKLKDQRAKLNDIKAQMTKKRKKLKKLRRRRDDADNEFMSVIRPMLVAQHGPLGASRSTLERRFTRMQRLRNEYQTLERDYEDLEVALDEEEDQLNKLETRFFSLLAVGNTMPSSEVETVHDEYDWIKNMPDDLKGISPYGPSDDAHPMYLELMSTVGDFENAKEELDELLFLKEQHDGELRMKKEANMALSEAEIEFMTEFPTEEQQMRSSVQELESQVARLRQMCEEKGVMQKHMSSRVAYLLYPEEGYEDIDLDDKSASRERHSSLVHPRFPLLLSQPEHVREKKFPQTVGGALKAAAKLPESDPTKRSRMQLASKEYAIDRLITDYKEGGKGDFINRWLLHQLRLSPLNVLLLYVTFTSSQGLKIRDPWRWQSDVLHYWWDSKVADPSEDSTKLVTSEDSNRGSNFGTTPPSRAATHPVRMGTRAQSQLADSTVAYSARA